MSKTVEEVKKIDLFVCGKNHFIVTMNPNEKIFLNKFMETVIPEVMQKEKSDLYQYFDFNSKNRYIKAFDKNGIQIKAKKLPNTNTTYFDAFKDEITELAYETDFKQTKQEPILIEKAEFNEKEKDFNEYVEIEKKNLKLEDRIATIEIENKQIKLENQEFKNKIDKLEIENQQIKLENQQMKLENQQMKLENQEFKNKIEKLETENQEIKTEISDIRESLKKEIENMKKDLKQNIIRFVESL